MNQHVSPPATALRKLNVDIPALVVTGPASIAIAAGVVFRGREFSELTPVPAPSRQLNGPQFEPGADYGVAVTADAIEIVRLGRPPYGEEILGGFHYAPGGNAIGRAGGGVTPEINPYSIWDMNFRPACPDPRGMVLIAGRDGLFWCDIYLTGVDHMDAGTSVYGAEIADGDSEPQDPAGGRFRRFDYAAACVVMAHHGKALLSYDEFVAAAYGVTECTSADGDPERTGLDAPRTSASGIMQATGNLWVWGHDGDPDIPRASIFGGSWWNDDDAGSRRAIVGYPWPDSSDVDFGARGRGDHLQLG
jgi:hypothetical protein